MTYICRADTRRCQAIPLCEMLDVVIWDGVFDGNFEG